MKATLRHKQLNNFYCLLFFHLITYNCSFGQHSAVAIENKEYLINENAATQSQLFQSELIGFRNIPSLDLKWQPILSSKGSADGNEDYENMVPDPEKLKKIKKEVLENLSENNNENSPNSSVAMPKLGQNFGTLFDSGSGSPTDNTVAISNGGWIVSAINAMICYTNENGVISYNQTLKNWINDPILPVNKFLCDPAII